MNPSKLMEENLVKMNLNTDNKITTIEKLVEMLAKEGILNDKNKFKEDILKREELTTTAVGHGVAIPHAKSSSVNEAKVAVGILPDGIKYDAPDNKEVKLIFMIAVNEGDNDIHLKALSNLSKMLINADFRQQLLKADNSQEVISIVKEFEK